MSSPTVAAVLTVHNRVELTTACLSALSAQQQDADAEVTAYLLDDGSTDGTAERVATAHAGTVLLHGDSSFFWNGGMRVAMARARKDDPDYYLWLNDDTILQPGAVRQLLDTAASHGGAEAPLIVCGAVTDPRDGTLAYSGVRQRRLRPASFQRVHPADEPVEVDTMNGNCVLLTREVVRRAGNLSPAYRHAMGDYDYGLRARRSGATVLLSPGVLGHCHANPGFVMGDGSILAEFARFRSIKYLPPGEWAHFTRTWSGPLWPLVWLSPYVRQLLRLVRRSRRRTS